MRDAEVMRGRGCDVTQASIEFTDPRYLDKFATFQFRQGRDGFASLLLGKPQVVKILQIEPKLLTCAKEMSEAQRGVAGNRARSM